MLFLLVACNQNEIENQDIIFDIDFKPQSKFVGTFQDSKGTEYIYFAEPVTRKYMKVFSITGQYLYTVSLKEAINLLQEINGIQVLAKDTILLHTVYDNQFCAINSNGTVYKKIFLHDFSPDKKNLFEFYSSLKPHNVSGSNMLFFHNYWIGNIDDEKLGKAPTEGFEYTKYINKGQYYSPYLTKVTNILEKPAIEFGADSFYARLSPMLSDFSELPFFSHTNHKVFILSSYSNQLFVVNENTLKIENKIPISSKYTDIGVKAIPIDTIAKYNMKNIQIESEPKGEFTDVFFNQKRKMYGVVLSYRIRNIKDILNTNKVTSSFSIITLDSNFKQIAENSFANKGYGNFIIPVKNGLLINKEIKTNDKQIIFTLFKDL